MTDGEILIEALYALEDLAGVCGLNERQKAAYQALRAALAQPEQEEDYDAIANKQLASLKAAAKVTFEDAVVRAVHKLYNAPPQREWVGLTDEDRQEIERWIEFKEAGGNEPVPTQKLITYVEAKLKEKNT